MLVATDLFQYQYYVKKKPPALLFDLYDYGFTTTGRRNNYMAP